MRLVKLFGAAMAMFSVKDPEVNRAIVRDVAAAVLLQALRDVKSPRYELQLDAFYFLSGDDLPVWLAAAYEDDPENLQDAGIHALSSGRIGELKKVWVKNG